MIRLTITILVTFTLLSTSCKSKNDTSTSPTPSTYESQGITDDFYTFYDTFHKDTSFQMSRINFPLKGRKLIEEVGGSLDYQYSKGEWIIHKPYDDMEGTFQRSFQEFQGIITETISGGGGQFTMRRTFAKLTGEWNLIYYEPMGMY